MIGIDVLLATLPGLQLADLERWVGKDWVRPQRGGGGLMFVEVDVARVRLILELRDGLAIDEDTLPVVLRLLDQLHDLRRRMREIAAAIDRTVPEPHRGALMDHLRGQGGTPAPDGGRGSTGSGG